MSLINGKTRAAEGAQDAELVWQTRGLRLLSSTRVKYKSQVRYGGSNTHTCMYTQTHITEQKHLVSKKKKYSESSKLYADL